MPDECKICAENEAAVPTPVQLRRLLLDEFDEDAEAFQPVAVTDEQRAAALQMAEGILVFIRAFGHRNTAARLIDTGAVIRWQAKLHAITQRRLAARAGLEPEDETPDYEGKDRDDAWLKGRGYAL